MALKTFEPYRVVARVRRPIAGRGDLTVPLKALGDATGDPDFPIDFPVDGDGYTPWFRTWVEHIVYDDGTEIPPYQYLAVEVVIQRGFPPHKASEALAEALKAHGFEALGRHDSSAVRWVGIGSKQHVAIG